MASDVPIAIVGVSALFPGSSDRRGFWADILTGRDLVDDVPPTHWLADDHFHPDPKVPDKTYSTRGAFLDDIPFSPMEHGIPPNVLEATDSGQLLALILARRVLQDALGDRFQHTDHRRTGVVFGAAAASELSLHMAGRLQRPLWEEGMRRAGLQPSDINAISGHIADMYTPWQESTFPGFLNNVIAGRVANRFDFGAHNQVVDAACASSLAALQSGAQQLQLGEADLMITGGVDLLNHILLYTAFSKIGALSPSGHCRPFSSDADGTVLAEGLGFFALQRLEDAEAQETPIYAVLRGIGASSDGRAKSIYAPRAEGQELALRRAYDQAGYDPSTVDLIEAHGTATAAGDAAEVDALHAIFDTDSQSTPSSCALGSIKSQIGHAKAAAGAAGLFKALMAIHHKTLPPTIGVQQPNPDLNLQDGPFYLNTEARPWFTAHDHPRRAGVSAFGFGGTNVHVTLEAYEGPAPNPPRLRSWSHELLLLSAPDPQSLLQACQDLSARATDNADLAEIALQTHRQFEPTHPARLALITQSTSALRRTLGAASDKISTAPERSFSIPDGTLHYGWQRHPGKVAFLFPGQGSQYLNMGAQWPMHFDACHDLWQRIDTSSWDTDLALHDVVFPPPTFDDKTRQHQRDRLTDTRWAQPSLGATSLSILALIRQLGITPDATAGHSYGEIPALFAAGVFDESTTLELSRLRGELMADAAARADHPGSMCAVHADAAELRQWLHQWELDLVIANHNSPDQCVLSGPTDAIETAETRLKQQRVATTRLPVATAFHSPLVADSSAPFLDALNSTDINPASIPVFANTTAAPYPDDPEAIRRLLAHQLAKPIRFVDQIRAMHDQGIRTFIEVGAHSTLTGLTQKCLADRPHHAIHLDRRGTSSLQSLLSAIGHLSTLGVDLDLQALWKNYEKPAPADPPPGPDAVLINGTGVNKPYPEDDPRPQPDPSTFDRPRSTSTMSDDQQWLDAFREQQQRIAEAHRVYQESTAEAHRAFLDTMRDSMTALASPEDLPTPPDITPTPSPNPPTKPTPRRTLGAAPPPPNATPNPPSQPTPSRDLTTHLIEVIADKTGYPTDMLQPSMELEADLGVDSIKQVEILADMETRFPRLEALESQELSQLRQIDRIAARMEELLGGRAPRTQQGPDQSDLTDDDDDDSDRSHPTTYRHHVAPSVPQPCGWIQRPLTHIDTIHITGADHPVAAPLRDLLTERGINVVLVDGPLPAGANAVIALDGLHHPDDLDDAITIAQQTLLTARDFAQDHRQNQTSPHLWISTQGATSTNNDATSRDHLRATTASIAELSKTAASEWPDACVKSITLDTDGLSPSSIARHIVDECWSGGPEIELLIDAGGLRSTPIATPSPLPSEDSQQSLRRLEDGDTVVVAGGGRGVTAASIIELARRRNLNFLILGRTELTDEPPAVQGVQSDADLKAALFQTAADKGHTLTPDELASKTHKIQSQQALRRTLGALTDLGSTPIYRSCDIRDFSALSDVIDEARHRWGSIDAVVHGAGVLADSWIADATASDFDRVFRTKVEGYFALQEATADDDLKALVFFSSIAARSGNPGQSDYAMANGALNRIAHLEARRRPNCLVKALGWGPWDGGMVTPSLKKHFQSEGVSLLPKDRGATLFADELLHGPPHQVELILGHSVVAEGINGSVLSRGVDLSIPISRATHPYLSDHRVRGVPVVPAVIVLDWFTRAARASAPHLYLQSITDLRIRQGIRLPSFDDGAKDEPCTRLHLTITAQGQEPHLTLHLELRDDHQLYYEATAQLGPDEPQPSPNLLDDFPHPVDPTSQWTVDGAYGDSPLFHGPAFQVLKTISHCDTEGATGRSNGLESLNWPTDSWTIDAPAIDGALQLGFLWGLDLIDQPTLPLRVDAFYSFSSERSADAPYDIRLQLRDHSKRHIEADLLVATDDGRPLYLMEGLQIFAVPDGI